MSRAASPGRAGVLGSTSIVIPATPDSGPAPRSGGAVAGTLRLAGGNGAVVFAEQNVPSGFAALLVAVVPVWMVVLDWMRPGGHRPRAAVFGGLALGLSGITLLVGPSSLHGGGGGGV